jgi:23S rRNA pseudouridine2605 synthase
LILEGRVEVDRQVVTVLGVKADPDRQEIRVDGEPLPRTRRAVYAVHKPKGVITTNRDPAGRPRVIDLLPPDLGRLYPVGRLDAASEGLILVTNDGELANRITHPRYGVEKTYQVEVAGHPDEKVLAELQRGVHLAEGVARALRIRTKSRRANSTLMEMVLDEGRNREIRRLLARVGHKVLRLTRIAVGPVRLGELASGAFRPLTSAELRALRLAAENSGSGGSPPKRKVRSGARPGPRSSESRTSTGPPKKSGPPKKTGSLKKTGSRSKTSSRSPRPRRRK